MIPAGVNCSLAGRGVQTAENHAGYPAAELLIDNGSDERSKDGSRYWMAYGPTRWMMAAITGSDFLRCLIAERI